MSTSTSSTTISDRHWPANVVRLRPGTAANDDGTTQRPCAISCGPDMTFSQDELRSLAPHQIRDMLVRGSK